MKLNGYEIIESVIREGDDEKKPGYVGSALKGAAAGLGAGYAIQKAGGAFGGVRAPKPTVAPTVVAGRTGGLLQHGADLTNKVKSSFTNVFAGKNGGCHAFCYRSRSGFCRCYLWITAG